MARLSGAMRLPVEVGLTDEEFAIFENVRDRTSTPTLDLE